MEIVFQNYVFLVKKVIQAQINIHHLQMEPRSSDAATSLAAGHSQSVASFEASFLTCEDPAGQAAFSCTEC